MFGIRFVILFLLSILLIGCWSFGPNRVHDWGAYNDVVQTNQSQQILKNIVRIRYAESIYFLNLTNITASYTLSPSLGLDAGYSHTKTSGVATTIGRTLNVTPDITYSETPTLSYVPVTNKLFITALLSPIRISDIAYLFIGGIRSNQTIFRLLVQNIGPIENAYSVSSLYPEYLPRYKQFYRFLAFYESLSRKGLIKVVPVNLDGQYLLVIHFQKNAANSHAGRQIRKILGLKANGKDIVLLESEFSEIPTLSKSALIALTPKSLNVDNLAGNVVYLKLRSIIGIMNYLSHGVQIPQVDIMRGFATLYRYPNGQPYDWAPLLSRIIAICYSDAEPGNAYVKTRVHGHWFYIRDDDFYSKLTFDLLNLLLTLRAGDQLSGVANPPILSLPVN